MLSSASVARGLRASSSRLPTKRYASHGAPQYNEPSGWLFGEKVRDFSSHIVRGSYDLPAKHQPPPPGQKRVKEDWENVWYIGMFGTMAFASVMLYYKPDTRCVLLANLPGAALKYTVSSIQTIALREAKERMEARGEKYRYEPQSTSSTPSS